MSVYDVAVPTDAAGEGSLAVGPFDKVIAASVWAPHDKYDVSGDPDTIVPRVGVRPSGDTARVVVAGGPPDDTVRVRVALAD